MCPLFKFPPFLEGRGVEGYFGLLSAVFRGNGRSTGHLKTKKWTLGGKLDTSLSRKIDSLKDHICPLRKRVT